MVYLCTCTTKVAPNPVMNGVMGPLEMAENKWVAEVSYNPPYRGYITPVIIGWGPPCMYVNHIPPYMDPMGYIPSKNPIYKAAILEQNSQKS